MVRWEMMKKFLKTEIEWAKSKKNIYFLISYEL